MAGETETVDQTTEQNPAQIEEGNADFEAGFTAQRLGSTETPNPTDALEEPGKENAKPTEQQPQATTTPPVQTTETPPAQGKKVEIDEAELAALRARAEAPGENETFAAFQKKFDQAFGQIGSLKQAIDKLRTETPAGEKVEISEEDFKDLVEAYPEIGKLTAQGLNKVLGKFKGTGGTDPEAIDRVVNERVAAARTEITKEVTQTVTDATLNGILPKWREKVKTAEFDTWFNAQPQDVQDLQKSDDLGDAALMLRKFRRHLERPTPTAAPTPAPKNTNTRQQRLAAGVPVKGDGSAPAPSNTEDDGFETGFQSGKA